MSFTNFKVCNKKKSEIFWQENLHVPSFYTTTNTTVLFQFLPLSSECCQRYLFLFSQFSQNLFLKNFHFMTALKNTQNSPLYSILKLTFPKIFKNESFNFSQYSQNFFSDSCLGSSDCLTNYCDILKSVSKVVKKFK